LDFLANKFVIQVACGQQHSICRAVERSQVQQVLAQGGAEVGVGSDCGADAYVWGNGTLGQLGLGTLQILMFMLSWWTFAVQSAGSSMGADVM
jgi:alpha-tubulin suppressor-like RCC1 family protein